MPGMPLPGAEQPDSRPHTATHARHARLAYSKAEAAQALGVSVDFLEDHVLPELRVARVGRRRLIPIAELERWLERHAERAPQRARVGRSREPNLTR
jgi:excisionase family DNA binding protein